MGTVAELVHVRQHRLLVSAVTPVGFGAGQVSFGQTQERNVRVGQVGVVGVLCAGAVGVFVGPFDDGQTIGDSTDFLRFDFASVAAVEQGTVVTGCGGNVVASVGQGHILAFVEVEVSHLCAGTDTGPGIVGAIEVLASAGVATADDSPGTAIGLRLCAILTDGEDNFLHGFGVAVVVAHEELLVTAEATFAGGGAQRVAAFDGFGRPFYGFSPFSLACISLGVEVEACQHDVGSHLIYSSEVLSRGVSFWQLGDDIFVFALDVIEEVLAYDFLGLVLVEGFLERSFAEEVEEVLVVHGAEETHLSTLAHTLLVLVVLVEVQEEVAVGDVVANAVVEHTGEEVLRAPAEAEELGLSRVVLPCPEAFVGRKFLLFPHTAEEGVLTGVIRDVGLVSGPLLSGKNEQAVDFCVVAVLVGGTFSLRVD